MNIRNSLLPMMIGCTLAQQGLAQSGSILQDSRCAHDSLSVSKSGERIGWARKHQLPFVTSGTATKWNDDWVNYAMHVNDINPLLKGRPVYPTYGKSLSGGAWTHYNNGTLYTAPVNRNAGNNLPSGFTQEGFCTSSCYRPEMKILLPEGYVDIKSIQDFGKHNIASMTKVVTLAAGSTLENLKFETKPIEKFSADIEAAEQDIARLEMADGNVLKVTLNHTFLNPKGEIREVVDLQEGDELIRLDGKKEKIAKIDIIKWRGKVLNLKPKQAADLVSQVIVAEGYLTGSSFFQNVELTDANRHLLRTSVSIPE